MRLITVFICGLVLAGCGGGTGGEASVVAAFYPLAFAASQVAAPGVRVENLTPPGVEPHDLEATPDIVRAVRDADHAFLLGHGFQPQLEAAAGRAQNIVYLLDLSALDARASDPHVWLDPLRYGLLVERIALALGRPAGSLTTRLERLDGEYRAGLRNCARREIVTSHAAFGYLADRYGLRQVAITGVTPDAEARPRDLARVIDTVRATHATTVFFEPLVSRKLADTVAHAAHVHTAVLDPIEGRPAQGDYFTAMRSNLSALREALGCR